MATAEFFDDFERADTVSGLGTAPTGQVWQDIGSGKPRILNGRFQHADTTPTDYLAVYERIDMTAPPVRRTFSFSLFGTTGPHAGIAVISSDDPTPAGVGLAFRKMIHVVIVGAAWEVDVYDAALPTMLAAGNFPLISGATAFNATLGVNCLLTNGTVYDATLDVDMATSTLHLVIAHGSDTLLDRTIVDARIATHHGKYLIWQSYQGQANVDAGEDAIPRFESVSGWASTLADLTARLTVGHTLDARLAVN